MCLCTEVIDSVLLEVDDDNDGFLTWTELRNASEKLNFFEKAMGMEVESF